MKVKTRFKKDSAATAYRVQLEFLPEGHALITVDPVFIPMATPASRPDQNMWFLHPAAVDGALRRVIDILRPVQLS